MSFSKIFRRSLIKFFKDVLPALPVIAIILAEVYSRFNLANYLKIKLYF